MGKTRIRLYPHAGMDGLRATVESVAEFLKDRPKFFQELGFDQGPEVRTDDWGRPYLYVEGSGINFRTREVIQSGLMSWGVIAAYVDVQDTTGHDLFRYTTEQRFRQVRSANLKIPYITDIGEGPTTGIVSVYWRGVQTPEELIEKDVSALKGPGVFYYSDDPMYDSPLYDLHVHHHSVFKSFFTSPKGQNSEHMAEIPLKHLKELALEVHRVGEVNRELGVEYVVIPASSEFVSDFLNRNFGASGDDDELVMMLSKLSVEVVPSPDRNHQVYLAGYDDDNEKLFSTDGFGTRQVLEQFFDIIPEGGHLETSKNKNAAITVRSTPEM